MIASIIFLSYYSLMVWVNISKKNKNKISRGPLKPSYLQYSKRRGERLLKIGFKILDHI